MPRYGVPLCSLILAFCGALPTGAAAQEHGGHEVEPAAEEHHGSEEGHGEEFEKNSIAVFIGFTQAKEEHGERDDPQFTLGFDYERLLSRAFGIGAVADFVVEGRREMLLAAAGTLHAGQAKFVLAPGGERVQETGDWEGIVRFGLMYAFPAGKVHLEPSLFYDVTQEEGVWVLGLTIGHEW